MKERWKCNLQGRENGPARTRFAFTPLNSPARVKYAAALVPAVVYSLDAAGAPACSLPADAIARVACAGHTARCDGRFTSLILFHNAYTD
eukprot:6198216-Pleurochrysis_carterae.AAC.3